MFVTDKWSLTFSAISELLEAIVLQYMHLHGLDSTNQVLIK